ncbi:MAG: dehydrogenase subunit [Verrucomicrobiota bacterium]|jgi:NADH-quinone oxidoreductase subunit I
MLGTGILKGMVETAKNFAGSYTDPANRLTTVEYPEQRIASKENARQFPFLVHDTEDPMKGLRCVACQICEKECPPQCIYIVKSKDKRADYKGQMQFYPATFDIDLSVCMSCQICVEVCPFESIKMDTEFELSNTDRFGGLLVNKHQLAKSNDHYRKIHPTEAGVSDAALAVEVAKAQAKAKADVEAKAKAAAEAKAKAEAAAAAGTAPAPAVPAGPKPSSPAASPAAAPAA